MQPPGPLQGRGDGVLLRDHLVRAVRTAGAEERALSPFVERDEPEAGARLGNEAKARLDPFGAQLAVEQAAEFVVADHTAERGAQTQPGETDGDVRRSAAGMNAEALAVAQPAAAIGEKVHERLAEAEHVERVHAPSISNRPMRGT